MRQPVNKEKQLDQFFKEIDSFFDRSKINQAAMEVEFSKRESPLNGFLFLTSYVFAVAIHGKPTLEQIVTLLNEALEHLDLTRQALNQRINEQAVELFKYMLSQTIKIQQPKAFSPDVLSPFNRVHLLDSTGVQLPPRLAEFFRGSGGNASKAALKIHFCYDLKSGCFSFHISEGRKPDNHYDNSFLDQLEAGDLRITDLGYSSSRVFVAIDQADAYYLTRMKSDLPLYQMNEAGEWISFDLIQFLKKEKVKKLIEIEVYLKSYQTYSKTRLVIEPVPKQVKDQRLRRLNREAKKKGNQIKASTKVLQGFHLYLSNAPLEKLPPHCFRILYSLRWQVELIFKCWKSNLNLDQISIARRERVLCDLYANLIFILLTHHISFVARNLIWMKKKREVSLYRATKHLKDKAMGWFQTIISQKSSTLLLKKAIDHITRHCLKSPQKDRIYPLEILEWIEWETNHPRTQAANNDDYQQLQTKKVG